MHAEITPKTVVLALLMIRPFMNTHPGQGAMLLKACRATMAETV